LTAEQHAWLQSLKAKKISMSQFIRTAIEVLRTANFSQKSIYEFKITARKMTVQPPKNNLQQELLAELKQVLAKRKIE